MFRLFKDAFAGGEETGMKTPPAPCTISSPKIEAEIHLDNSIDVKVSRGDRKAIIHIPHAAMSACAFFHTYLVHGSHIKNAEPEIFQIIVDYLSNEAPVTVETLSAGKPDESVLFTFAKAWQLGHELDIPDFQNALIDELRVLYATLLEDRVRVTPSLKPFIWLRDYVGYHTTAEKFLVDFYAGLICFDRTMPGSKLTKYVTDDIAHYIKLRWDVLRELGSESDRILTNAEEFKVYDLGESHYASVLHIVTPRTTIPASLAHEQASAALARKGSWRKARQHSTRSVDGLFMGRARLSIRDPSSLASFPEPDLCRY